MDARASLKRSGPLGGTYQPVGKVTEFAECQTDARFVIAVQQNHDRRFSTRGSCQDNTVPMDTSGVRFRIPQHRSMGLSLL